MKKISSLMILFSILFIKAYSQDASIRKSDPVGKWKFEAPYAPEGYTSGTLTFGLTENKYSAEMIFTGMDYKFVGEKVKMAGDSLSFTLYVEGELVNVSLKLADTDKMSGKAAYSEGIVPLVATRDSSVEKKTPAALPKN